MRVAILGASGVIGKNVIPRLIEHGHIARGIARNAEEAQALQRSGAEATVADVFDPATLVPALDGCDAAIHLATAIPPPGPHQDWSLNDRIRTEGTENLIAACEKAGVPRYVQQSIAFLAGGTSEVIDEDVPLLPGTEVTASAITMEGIVARSSLDWTIIRDGALYGPGTGREAGWCEQAIDGTLKIPGSGSDFVSLVHVADLADAFVLALERPNLQAVIAVVDDQPVTYRELFDFITDQLAAAKVTNSGATTMPSFRVSNARAKSKLGWQPFYRSFRSGLAASLARGGKDGR